MEWQSRIIAAIEAQREEMLALLCELVRTPSLSPNEGAVQTIVERELRGMNLELDVWDPPDEELRAHPAYVPVEFGYRDRPNVVGVYRGVGGGRSLILNGHVDVVPTGTRSDWRFDPWGAEYLDGRVYGRGSADMKGGCVANITALKALIRAGIRLRGDLILESVVDEENGGNGTLACIIRGYTADACNFTEPTGLDRAAVSSRGAQYFRITIPGQEGGIEYKYRLTNPIGKAMEVFRAVEEYAIMRESAAKHPLYNDCHETKVPLGICTIGGGEWPSTVPSRCVMEGTIECLPGEDIHAVKEGFKQFLMEWAAKDQWLKDNPLELEWFGLWFEAAEITPEHPFVATAAGASRDLTGRGLEVVGGGGCDLRLPVLYGDTPAMVFGPKGGMIHSTDEYVELEQVVTCAKVLAVAAARWCGVADH